ncbi:MAG TPA: hypothetical protein VMB72_03590 [Acidimicrobiales bacterium]|nr:hypothetical protein [Acidimicrobiales bacterium]
MGFDALADELYRLPPERFVAARQAGAKELAAAGERRAAADLRALRKPSPAAWLVNVTAREHADELGQLLALRSRFTTAQARRDADALRRVSAERRALVAGLVSSAAAMADRHGRSVSPEVLRQVEETLEAAVADEAVAAAVRRGRLVEARRHVGFGDVAVPAPGAAPRPARPRGRAPDGGPAPTAPRARAAAGEARARAELARRTAALEEARTRHAEAEAQRRTAARALQDAERRCERAARELTRAEGLVQRARDTLDRSGA